MKKIVLSSEFRRKTSDKDLDNYEYQFKLNSAINVTNFVKLEKFYMQNLQQQFSKANMNYAFIIETDSAETKQVDLASYYPTVQDLIKDVTSQLAPFSIRLAYDQTLFQFRFYWYENGNPIVKFRIKELEFSYGKTRILQVFGFKETMTYEHEIISTMTPKLYAKEPLYININEFGAFTNGLCIGQAPFTFAVLAQNGTEIDYNANYHHDNTIYFEYPVKTSTITVTLRNADGYPIYPLKEKGNLMLILSYL